MVRYKTWVAMRLAIDAKNGEPVSDGVWNILKQLLYASAVHPPCDDADIAYGCRRLKKLLNSMEED